MILGGKNNHFLNNIVFSYIWRKFFSRNSAKISKVSQELYLNYAFFKQAAFLQLPVYFFNCSLAVNLASRLMYLLLSILFIGFNFHINAVVFLSS